MPGKGVLHPVLVVTVRVVLTGVGATGFLAVGSGFSGLDGASEQVAELESLDEVRVPDHTAVLDTDLAECRVDFTDPEWVGQYFGLLFGCRKGKDTYF